LVRYTALLAERPASSLLDYLLDSKALSENDQQFLCRIVDTIIHAHHGDERAAFKAFGGEEAASDAFAGSIVHSDSGWGPSEDQTILADQLPHGLPAQILPETIGRYTRGSEYARGGIGRILLVHDEQIGRDVILKELLPEHISSPTDSTLSQMPKGASPKSPMRKSASMMARFLQEAKITGQLEHPSIVPVYELGTRKDGQLYYTMKLVRGDTLSVAIKDCKSLQDRLALLRSFLDVCQAMAYAHSKGVIHRDLKPSNIMVGEFGECVVLDWGLAKMQRDVDAHREALEKTISQLKLGEDKVAGMQTRSKDVLGTPLYMAPEQARGEVDGVGLHSDVYSLGVILYEILSGELPHPWSNSLDTIRRVGTLPAPGIRKIAPHTPPELAAICDKALSFDARKRYASAKELATDMQHFLEGAVVGAYAYKFTDLLGRLYKKHRPIILTSCGAALLLLLLGGLSYVSIYKARGDAIVARGLAETARDVAKNERAKADAERNRATAAEARTAQEKYVSDIRLADAYVRNFKFQAAEDTLLATEPRFRNLEWGYLAAQCNQDLATLRGHTNVVFESFFSPDGNSIVTVGGDFTARLWNAQTYAQVHEWRFPDIYLRHAVYAPNGATLALCLSDGSVRMVDPVSGAELFSLAGHTAPVNYCTFNAAGDRLVTASSDRTVKIWDLATRAVVLTLEDQGGEVKAVGYCNAEQSLYTVPDGKPMRLYSLDGRFLAEGPGMGVHAPADGALLVARNENEVVVYKGNDLSVAVRLPHEDSVERVTYYPELQRVVTACADGIARVWRIPEGTIEQVFNVRHPLRDCKLSPDGRLLAAVAANGLTVVWERASAREVTRFSGHREATAGLEFDQKGGRILTWSMDQTARLWLAEQDPSTIKTAEAGPKAYRISTAPKADMASLITRSGHMLVQDLKSETPVYTASFQPQIGALEAALAPDGRALVVVPDNFLPILVSLPDGKVIRRLEGHEGYITGVAYSGDGATIATSSWDDTVRLWDGKTGEGTGVLRGHKDTVQCVALSQDGKYVASGSIDKTAIVWERSGGTKLFEIQHKRYVTNVAFSHDGTLVATASDDGTMQVWQIDTAASLFELSAQMYDVERVAFSPDDKRLLSISSGNTLRLWELEGGQTLVDIDAAESSLADATFGPEPGTLLLASDSGDLLELNVPLDDPASPSVDAASLKYFVDAFRSRRNARRLATPPPPATERLDRILPQPQALESLRALIAGTDPAQSEPLAITEALEALCWPLGVAVGDTLLNINGKAQPDYAAYTESIANATLPPEGASFYLDVVRNLVPLRINVSYLPVDTESRELALPDNQARALLEQGAAVLAANTEFILQVNRHWAEYARLPLEKPDSIAGLWITDPTDLLHKKMLQAAGLQAGARLLSYNGNTITNSTALLSTMSAARQVPSVDLRLRITHGEFCTVDSHITIEGPMVAPRSNEPTQAVEN
jgi:WD40 repeat protein/serine/threonine protein kinase